MQAAQFLMDSIHTTSKQAPIAGLFLAGGFGAP